MNEVLLASFYTSLITHELNLIETSSANLAVFGIKIVIATLGFNVFVCFLKLSLRIYERIKSKCKRSPNQIASTQEATHVNKVWKDYFR